jgi:hypothetical protein
MTFRAPSSDVRPFRPRCISSSNALKAAPETPSSRTDLQAWYRCAARDQQATYSSACLWDHSSLPIGKARCLGWFRKITFKGAAIVGPNLYIRPGIDRAFAVAGPRAGWPRNRSLLIGLGSRRRSASQAIDLPADGGITGRLITPSIAARWRLSLSLSAPTLLADEIRMVREGLDPWAAPAV